MNNVLAERIEHSSEGVRYSVSVEAVCWEEWKSDREAGLPTPWEIPTESVADLIADIILKSEPELFYDSSTVAKSWERVYKVAEPMASEWARRFGHVA